MEYGFVIDNRRCIGCHACTVACKAEHEVPLGNFRTWVKYVEKGTFPDVRRYFTVLRCNHCQDAPCVNICPTRALFHRHDGIVDFDKEQCVACKACMAACPYDAIYIDPSTETAAKCNYCAHKVELGLEPACVTVCPEQAIIAGDFGNPQSPISRLVALEQVMVRKPEKGTMPKVFYIAGDSTSLTPGAAPRPVGYIWAQRPQSEIDADYHRAGDSGVAYTSYDVSHAKPWGFMVSFYLWTKSMAAGPILAAALLTLSGYARAPVLFGRLAPMAALVFTFLTVILLISDLGRPARFLKILLHPNPRSWLVWGAQILTAYSTVALLWLAAGLLLSEPLFAMVQWPGLILSTLAAGYSAFLLAQARARDLWQSRLLFPHLVVQAFLAGSAVLSIGAVYAISGRALVDLLLRSVLGGLVVHGILILSEVALPAGNKDASDAVRYMIQGPLAVRFWFGAVFCGVALPIYLLAFYFSHPGPGSLLPAAVCAGTLLGLLVYEDCYVIAGQALPLS
ncbi:MAG TPA: 4Fe-4S dicluster domain-containing protein [Acidobacteriota bacterium]|nr:4Fe-4S dicluster domain-containing protein [Acidobacteriota bacterium]